MDIVVEEERGKSIFTIKSIEKSEPPKDMAGQDWYRYIVRHKRRTITGFKTGTLESVTEHVESFTEGLNERSASGASPNAHSSRGRK